MEEIISLIERYETIGKELFEKIGVLFFKDNLQMNHERFSELVQKNKLAVSAEAMSLEKVRFRVETYLGEYKLFAVFTVGELQEYFPELVELFEGDI